MSSTTEKIGDGRSVRLSTIIEQLKRDSNVGISTVIEKTGIKYYVGDLLIREEDIEKLKERGVIVQHGFIGLMVCPNCGEYAVAVMPTCPKCGSNDVMITELVAHVKCGFIGLSKDFLKDGAYVCPNCGEVVNDYSELRYFGKVFMCANCKARFDMPSLKFKCLSCGLVFSIKDIQIKRVPQYVVDRVGLEKVSHILVLESIKDVIEEVARRIPGCALKTSYEIRGLSGITHRVPFVLQLDSKTICIYPLLTERDVASFTSFVLDVPEGLELVVICKEDVLRELGISCDSLAVKNSNVHVIKLTEDISVEEVLSNLLEKLSRGS